MWNAFDLTVEWRWGIGFYTRLGTSAVCANNTHRYVAGTRVHAHKAKDIRGRTRGPSGMAPGRPILRTPVDADYEQRDEPYLHIAARAGNRICAYSDQIGLGTEPPPVYLEGSAYENSCAAVSAAGPVYTRARARSTYARRGIGTYSFSAVGAGAPRTCFDWIDT